jgi:type II secretory pathway pseudopilin PulG
MRIPILAATLAAVSFTAVPATAQTNPNREYRQDVREAQREYRRDVRDADTRGDLRDARREYQEDVRDARQDRRENARDWRRYRNYDYNRLPAGQRTYFADQYYRDGRYYQPRRLTRNDRIYRGSNGQYYCRRNDGTTGLIVGGVAGGLFGNALSNGRSSTLATLLGAAGGAAIGSSVDRGNVRCR